MSPATILANTVSCGFVACTGAPLSFVWCTTVVAKHRAQRTCSSCVEYSVVVLGAATCATRALTPRSISMWWVGSGFGNDNEGRRETKAIAGLVWHAFATVSQALKPRLVRKQVVDGTQRCHLRIGANAPLPTGLQYHPGRCSTRHVPHDNNQSHTLQSKL
jgi:hypothetical protein